MKRTILEVSKDSRDLTMSDDESARSSPPGHSKHAKEVTPLLAASSRDNQGHHVTGQEYNSRYAGQDWADQSSRSSSYLFLLCLGIGGLQMAWATELSNGSPYLLSLGMSKSWLAMVWVAGPLSGVLVQPIIGSLSDNCKISWGRRRPYMLAGTVATVLSLLALAWTREIVRGVAEIFGGTASSDTISKVNVCFAVAWIYILDFSVNTLQASIRAFIVDNAPVHQQDQANAWASRIVGFGNILGYLSGYINLPMLLPFFGDTQFKVLCAVACIFLIVTVSISCLSVQEADPRVQWPSAQSTNRSAIKFFEDCLTSFTRLTPQTQLVCVTQFFNWMGWFPFLFYITTYIGQLYLNPFFEQNPNLSRDEINKAWEPATRFGAYALLIFAIVSFTANSLLPLFIEPTYSHQRTRRTNASISPLSHLCSSLHIPHFTIRRAWLISHLLFAACMFSTLFITTAAAAAVMTGIVGLSWAMTLWAPFALISTDISRLDTLRRARKATLTQQNNANNPAIAPPQSATSFSAETNVELAAPTEPEDEDVVEDQAGAVLGLHNVAVSAPQIVATVVSSIVFKLLQRERGVAGDDSVGWVLRLGGLAALAAAWRTTKIREEGEGGWSEEGRRAEDGEA